MAISFDFSAMSDKTFVQQDTFVLDYIVETIVIYHNPIDTMDCFHTYK
tara:strand:+ start:1184 stop:1327 length:144 start_codon:yes stop_codon:yes gene_type:complete